MKVIILCGGMGTRLREETEYKPKPMVEIAGRPILWHIMKLYSHYGFKDFILCMGYKHQVIRDYFLNYRYMNSDVTISLSSNDEVICHNCHDENWNVTLAYTGYETKKGKRIKMVDRYLNGERFMVTYGDGLSNVNIMNLIAHHDKESALATFTGVHPISRFATVEHDESGKIIDFEEKKTLENYINAGFFVLESDVLEYIDGDVEFEEEPMKRIAQEGHLAMYRHEGFWQCMDTYRDYLLLTELWESGGAPWKVWE
jgi:glucose-1-phosphate cytidylyltransferase